MRLDESVGSKILHDMEMAGVDKWEESALILRCRFKGLPLEQWGIRREFLRRMKQVFDASGIEIPFPRLTVCPGQAKDGSAPTLHIVNES